MSSPDVFAVWAPEPESVSLVVAAVGGDADLITVAMERDEAAWWRPVQPFPPELVGRGGGRADLAPRELDYGFLLGSDPAPIPDPRSRRQPDGVHGLSRTFDPAAYAWGDQMWTGRQLAGGVIYELHIGTFTAVGTLAAAIQRLDHLVALGIDFVEIMPVNGFNGSHNWGYDGVLWFAVHEEYGGPAAYQLFVDACHQRGLGVIQDVVYNHLGPSGNYLSKFGAYLAAGHNTWGDTVNIDGEDSDQVRRYILDNAAMWMRDYHVDGLRLDAVHALTDTTAEHILEELTVETEALSTFLGRPLSLIAESDLNDPRLITPREGGGYGLTAQWNDDFHHALYVSLTGDTSGYYADFASLSALGKVFENGFFHDGTHSTFRGRRHGNKIDTIRTPTWRLVVCSDNHDQIGNRAAGERLSSRLSSEQLGIAAVLTLLSPFTPMIFMGEEWGARTPWQFFTAHPEPELAEKVATGRKEEFAQMDWDLDAVPDPQDLSTFANSKLDWSEPADGAHAELLELYARLLAVRRQHADLTDPRFDRAVTRCDDEAGWLVIERESMVLAVNFSDRPAEVSLTAPVQEVLVVGAVATDNETVRLGSQSAVVAVRQ